MNQQLISMMRASAPKVPLFDEVLRATWLEIASSGESLASNFQAHRFEGTDRDRAAALAWIGSRIDPAPHIERVMVTNGTMNSILLLTASVVGPGNVILAEELTFPIAYTLMDVVGARVQPVRIDEQGMIPDDFERKCATLKPKAVYVNSTLHSPTAYITPTDRRECIARIAQAYGVQIIEDEAQAHYVDDAPKSYATLAPDLTWYLMGLSKYLSLGVRLAYVVAPSRRALGSVLERFRPVTTWHPAPIIAHLVTRWIEDGRARDLFSAARDEVRRRQDVVTQALSGVPGFRRSPGIHFWVPAPTGNTSTQFSEALAVAGVSVRPSRLYSGREEPRFHGIRPAVGEPVDLDETRRGVEIIRDVHRALAVRAA